MRKQPTGNTNLKSNRIEVSRRKDYKDASKLLKKLEDVIVKSEFTLEEIEEFKNICIITINRATEQRRNEKTTNRQNRL